MSLIPLPSPAKPSQEHSAPKLKRFKGRIIITHAPHLVRLSLSLDIPGRCADRPAPSQYGGQEPAPFPDHLKLTKGELSPEAREAELPPVHPLRSTHRLPSFSEHFCADDVAESFGLGSASSSHIPLPSLRFNLRSGSKRSSSDDSSESDEFKPTFPLYSLALDLAF